MRYGDISQTPDVVVYNAYAIWGYRPDAILDYIHDMLYTDISQTNAMHYYLHDIPYMRSQVRCHILLYAWHMRYEIKRSYITDIWNMRTWSDAISYEGIRQMPYDIGYITYAIWGHNSDATCYYINYICDMKTQFRRHTQWYNFSYSLFADADTGIYPHAALQYHARPKAKRGIAMLSVDKFPYPRKQTRGNEFIPCSNNVCDILSFHSFKIPAFTLIWPKSPYKHSVTRSYRSGKESGLRGRNRHCDVINGVTLSLYLTLMTSNVRYGSIFYGC